MSVVCSHGSVSCSSTVSQSSLAVLVSQMTVPSWTRMRAVSKSLT